MLELHTYFNWTLNGYLLVTWHLHWFCTFTLGLNYHWIWKHTQFVNKHNLSSFMVSFKGKWILRFIQVHSELLMCQCNFDLCEWLPRQRHDVCALWLPLCSHGVSTTKWYLHDKTYKLDWGTLWSLLQRLQWRRLDGELNIKPTYLHMLCVLKRKLLYLFFMKIHRIMCTLNVSYFWKGNSWRMLNSEYKETTRTIVPWWT